MKPLGAILGVLACLAAAAGDGEAAPDPAPAPDPVPAAESVAEFREIVDFTGGSAAVQEWVRGLGATGTPVRWSRNADAAAAVRLLTGGEIESAVVRMFPEELASLDRLEAVPLAVCAGAIWVNTANPMANISLDAARKAISGAYIDWSEISGSPYQLHRFGMAPSSFGAADLTRRLLGDMEYSPQIFRLPSPDELEIMVGGAEHAIGYGWYCQNSEARARALALDGVAPAAAAISDGSYPLGFIVALLIDPEHPAAEFWRSAAETFIRHAAGDADYRELLRRDRWLDYVQPDNNGDTAPEAEK